MKRKILACMAILLLLATTATALTLEGSCDIRFSGQSTLHGFDGKVACQPFVLTSENEAEKNGIIRQPAVKVLVAEMDTGNSGRDKKMHAMFEQGIYPQIQGLFADLDPDRVLQQWQAVDAAPGHLEFNLRIREISQQVEAEVSNLLVTPEQISFAMKFPLSLASFKLQPPSVFGFIKVDDLVQVEISVVLRRQ
jgi:hypothetical protein